MTVPAPTASPGWRLFCARVGDSPQRPTRLKLPLVAGMVSLMAMAGAPGWAQQQTGYTLSWSQGRSVSSSSRSLSQSAANSLAGVELLQPLQPPNPPFGGNVRRIVRPDGSVAYEILDPDRPFGSYSGSVAREREQQSNTRSFSSFSGIGYSVFHP